MSKKNNGKKPQSDPPEVKLTREQTLELRFLNEQQRRIQLELNALNEDNVKNRRDTEALRAVLKKDHDGVDVLGKYVIDFDTQTGKLMQQQGQPGPAIIEADAEDEEVPEPVASA